MRWLYNILFPILLVLGAPHYLLKLWRRGNWRRGFGQRFGRYPAFPETGRPRIWLHAVSVGEANLCIRLLESLGPRFPETDWVVSTTTSTGMGELERKLPASVIRVYYPMDFAPFVKRALDRVRPAAVILVEAEIWPNFLWLARDRGIPVCLANARLSERSEKGYRRLAPLFRPLFSGLRAVGAQNEQDAKRLRSVGCRPEAVTITGNLKFDLVRPDQGPGLDATALLRRAGWRDGDPVLLAGSTHAGEEPMLARMTERLRLQFPNLFLVLVPRHFERARQVGEALNQSNIPFLYRSKLDETASRPESHRCLIVDSTGELLAFYRQASLVVIGKSFRARGGQNPIEPAALGKPVLFGPHMENFRPIVAALKQGNGALQVKDEAELETVLARLLEDDAERQRLGARGLAVVAANRGATERTADWITSRLRRESEGEINR